MCITNRALSDYLVSWKWIECCKEVQRSLTYYRAARTQVLNQQRLWYRLEKERHVRFLAPPNDHVNQTCIAVTSPVMSNSQLITSVQHLFILFYPLPYLCAQMYLAPTLPNENKKKHPTNQRMKCFCMCFILPATCIRRSFWRASYWNLSILELSAI